MVNLVECERCGEEYPPKVFAECPSCEEDTRKWVYRVYPDDEN